LTVTEQPAEGTSSSKSSAL